MRAIALENGIDPDTTCPEDLLLLRKDKDGCLLVAKEADAATKRLEFEHRQEQAREWLKNRSNHP